MRIVGTFIFIIVMVINDENPLTADITQFVHKDAVIHKTMALC
jgi:hypothetical protein